MAKTRITIDYAYCGDGVGVDPRECGACLRACRPAVFLLHQTIGAVEPNPYDPQAWRVTPLWPSLCDGCGECVKACPQKAIEVRAARRKSPGPGKGPRSFGGSGNGAAPGVDGNDLS